MQLLQRLTSNISQMEKPEVKLMHQVDVFNLETQEYI